MWKPEGKRPLGRPRRRWEDGIRWILERLAGGVEWIQLAQDMYGPVTSCCEYGDERTIFHFHLKCRYNCCVTKDEKLPCLIEHPQRTDYISIVNWFTLSSLLEDRTQIISVSCASYVIMKQSSVLVRLCTCLHDQIVQFYLHCCNWYLTVHPPSVQLQTTDTTIS
jgi:hypothetical protein